MTVRSGFFNFLMNNEYPAFFNVVNQHALRVLGFSALFEGFFKVSCLMMHHAEQSAFQDVRDACLYKMQS